MGLGKQGSLIVNQYNAVTHKYQKKLPLHPHLKKLNFLTGSNKKMRATAYVRIRPLHDTVKHVHNYNALYHDNAHDDKVKPQTIPPSSPLFLGEHKKKHKKKHRIEKADLNWDFKAGTRFSNESEKPANPKGLFAGPYDENNPKSYQKFTTSHGEYHTLSSGAGGIAVKYRKTGEKNHRYGNNLTWTTDSPDRGYDPAIHSFQSYPGAVDFIKMHHKEQIAKTSKSFYTEAVDTLEKGYSGIDESTTLIPIKASEKYPSRFGKEEIKQPVEQPKAASSTNIGHSKLNWVLAIKNRPTGYGWDNHYEAKTQHGLYHKVTSTSKDSMRVFGDTHAIKTRLSYRSNDQGSSLHRFRPSFPVFSGTGARIDVGYKVRNTETEEYNSNSHGVESFQQEHLANAAAEHHHNAQRDVNNPHKSGKLEWKEDIRSPNSSFKTHTASTTHGKYHHIYDKYRGEHILEHVSKHDGRVTPIWRGPGGDHDKANETIRSAAENHHNDQLNKPQWKQVGHVAPYHTWDAGHGVYKKEQYSSGKHTVTYVGAHSGVGGKLITPGLGVNSSKEADKIVTEHHQKQLGKSVFSDAINILTKALRGK